MRLPRPLWRNGGTPCWGRRYQPKPTLPPSSSAPFEPSLSLATYSAHLTNSKQGDYRNLQQGDSLPAGHQPSGALEVAQAIPPGGFRGTARSTSFGQAPELFPPK